MKLEQIYTGCLAQGAYYIESDGEAAVIDPLREVDSYIRKATKNNARIKYVFETHFHADFVSGHLELSKRTGAPIVYGPNANPDFKAHIARDNEVFTIGKLTLTVLHTPGHTMESTCYLLKNESGKAIALFSGDTLFIGDVGRPDLAQKLAGDLTQEVLAGHLYESLHKKIIPLADDIIVYPAHGAGSACGKNMSRETSDTLGHQKQVNYALQPQGKEEFIKAVTEGLEAPPAYFSLNVELNKQGAGDMQEVLQKAARAMSPDEFEAIANETGALLLDTRAPQLFAAGFIPNSISIGIDGSFAPWVGALIPDIRQNILLITDEGREEEVITRLARVGYDYTIGYLKGGFAAWQKAGKETDRIESVDAATLHRRIQNENAVLLDVRKENEYNAGHIDTAVNMPLDTVNEHLPAIDKNKNVYVHCASGYRSMIFSSILKARGYDHVIDVKGGFKGIKESDLFEISEEKIVKG